MNTEVFSGRMSSSKTIWWLVWVWVWYLRTRVFVPLVKVFLYCSFSIP